MLGAYRPDGDSARRANLKRGEKLRPDDFRNDQRPLVGTWPDGYDIDLAVALVHDEVLQ